MVRSSFAAISAGVGNEFDIGGVTPHCLTGAAAITVRARGPLYDGSPGDAGFALAILSVADGCESGDHEWMK